MTLVRFTEWEGQHTRLVRLGGLPASGKYLSMHARDIRSVICHQSAGTALMGEDAPVRIAAFHAGTPKYRMKDGKIAYRKVGENLRKHWIGGGRGWPGIGYQFVVPAIPDTVDGKLEVFRTHADEVRSYHTGGLYNTYGIGVVVAGTYRSRHIRKSAARTRDRPDPTAALALKELVLDFLLPRYNLTPHGEGALLGHFDAGKSACPGDFIEQWIRATRGEDVFDPIESAVTLDGPPKDIDETEPRALHTDSEKQSALRDLGMDVAVDGIWGPLSRMALTAFQTIHLIVADGIWGPITERTVRAALGGWRPPDR